jgi:hypothetical protein
VTFFGSEEGAHRCKNCGNANSHAGCSEKKKRKADAEKNEIANPLVIEPRTRSGIPKVDVEKRKRDDAKPVGSDSSAKLAKHVPAYRADKEEGSQHERGVDEEEDSQHGCEVAEEVICSMGSSG